MKFHRAYWVVVEEENGEEHYMCSNCEMEWFLAFGNPIENEMHYCPRCGYSMKMMETE